MNTTATAIVNRKGRTTGMRLRRMFADALSSGRTVLVEGREVDLAFGAEEAVSVWANGAVTVDVIGEDDRTEQIRIAPHSIAVIEII